VLVAAGVAAGSSGCRGVPNLVTRPGIPAHSRRRRAANAYEDLAGVLKDRDESAFAYGRQIAGFWRSFCALNRVGSGRGGTGLDTKVMLYTIGWSFTAELAGLAGEASSRRGA
jgi:hypothetical protein